MRLRIKMLFHSTKHWPFFKFLENIAVCLSQSNNNKIMNSARITECYFHMWFSFSRYLINIYLFQISLSLFDYFLIDYEDRILFIVCLHLKIFKFENGEIFIVPHMREAVPLFSRRDLYRATHAVRWCLCFCGGIFIVPHMPWGGASVFAEGSLSCHTCREVEPRFLWMRR